MSRLSPAVAFGVLLVLPSALVAQSGRARDAVTYNQLITVGTPPGTTGAAVAPLPSGGALMFGGATDSGVQGSTYTLIGSTWTLLSPVVRPVARTDASLVLDPVRQNNLLFGGKDSQGAALGDTWVWGNGQWSLLTVGVHPSPRWGHEMAFDTVNNRVLLFGGYGGSGNFLNDFWSWDGAAWTQLTPSVVPPGRIDFGMAWDEARGRLVLYGGPVTWSFSDLWEWDGVTWTQIPVASSLAFEQSPGDVGQIAMAYHPLRRQILLYGGDKGQLNYGANLWSWSGSAWTMHVATSGAPTGRVEHSMWFDSSANEMRLHGGYEFVYPSRNRSNETWSFALPLMDGWSFYGQGCSGALGVPVLAQRAGSGARAGQNLVCDLTNVPTTPLNPAFGLYDVQRNYFSGIPVPVSLAFAGLPGCAAWTGGSWAELLPPMQAGVGTSLSVSIPNASWILGASIYLQALVFDNSNGRWASVSNAVEARVGDDAVPLAADFSTSAFVGPAPFAVLFSDSSQGSPTSWQWDFQNDGTVDSTARNPSFLFTGLGMYEVRLTVANASETATTVRKCIYAHAGQLPSPALNMVPIPAGAFDMGTDSGFESPVHRVTLTNLFWIGKYEVTQSQFQVLMGFNPARFPHAGSGNMPVDSASWISAMAFCAALNAQESAAGRVPGGYQYRLPTEAEWEYACRAGTTTYWNTGAVLLPSQANIWGSGGLAAVGSYPPNAWGLHDMHGTLWEMCLDEFDVGARVYSGAAVTNPYSTNGCTSNCVYNRVSRGGDYTSPNSLCRSSSRYWYPSTSSLDYVGFRVVLAPILP